MSPTDLQLDALAAALQRAEQVRDATRDAAASRLTVALNTRLAIHPDTIRRAASELISARRAVEAQHAGTPTPPAEEPSATDERQPQAPATTPATLPVVGALVLVIGLMALVVAGGAAVTTGHLAVAVVTAIAALAIVVVAVEIRRIRTGVEVATAGSLPTATRHAVDPNPGNVPTMPLRAAQDALAVAGRRWEQLAGADTDPEAVEEVIRRYQPQHEFVTELVEECPAVRAVERAATARREAWDSARSATRGA